MMSDEELRIAIAAVFAVDAASLEAWAAFIADIPMSWLDARPALTTTGPTCLSRHGSGSPTRRR